MHTFTRVLALATAIVFLAACGKSQDNADAPLAFVPADTPYVYANLEPTPAAVTTQWSQHMQEYWPAVFDSYQSMLNESKNLDERHRRIASAILDEIKTRDSWDKLREIGLKPDMRMAFYGVGLAPVLRIELGDPAAFKAMIARIEQKVGEKIPLAKTGNQEFWRLGNDTLAAIVAIEGTHLVATIAPSNADDALTQALLGVVRPAQNLAVAGTLQALAKQYAYSPYGEGYVDFARLADRLSSAPAGTDQAFAKALGLPMSGSDAVCKKEYLEIAHKFPRAVAGTEELTAQKIRLGAQLEIETALAQQIAAALAPAPGTGAAGTGVVDVSLALPVLKLKDFWIAQADAIAAKPFACATLTKLNDSYRESKAKVDVTVPPPFSDLTGVRFTLSKIDLREGQMIPDIAGKFLMASNNPLAALAMAQLTLTPLKNLKIAADSKPVAVPLDMAPANLRPLSIAMSDKAIAVAAGAGEDATLGAYLAAPAAATPAFMRMYFSGAIYGVMAHFADKAQAMLPPESRSRIGAQGKMFGMYEKWVRSGEITLVATPTGIALHETVEMN